MLPALDAGGVERGTLEVGQALAAAGHRSLVMSAGGRLVELLEKQGSEHFAWPVGKKSPWTFRMVGALRKFLVDEQVDVIDVRSRMPAWVVWRAWSKMPPHIRPGLVTSVHGFNSVSRYSEILTRGERVVAVSESLKRVLLGNYCRLRNDRVEVIHRGVDTSRYHPDYRPTDAWLAQWQADFPELRGKLVLTLPGRITRLKGHLDALAVLDAARRRAIPAHLLIVGGADVKKTRYSKELHQRSHALGLASHTTFTGHRSDLREILAISDVVLSLSTKPESFGRATLEALSLGRLVIGYDHGGVAEQLAALFPEGLVPVGDTQAVCDRLGAWSSGNKPAPAWPHAWTLDEMCNRTIGVYERLINTTHKEAS